MNDAHNADSALAAPSAVVVVPFVLKVVGPIESVVDVGCGSGAWLAAFADHGCGVRGIDRPDLQRDTLVIDPLLVELRDLTEPFVGDSRFDLAVSLETAEHLRPESAPVFIRNIVSLSDLVLFSAAAPGQGGPNHVNEQWPSYWAREFGRHGYQAIDCLRSHFWTDERVAWWYRQNMMLFATADALERLHRQGFGTQEPLPLVHPRAYEKLQSSGVSSLRDIPAIVGRSARSRLRRRYR